MKRSVLLCLAVPAVAFAAVAQGQVIAPEFAGSYAFTDLGGVPMLPGPAGGLTLLAGDPNTLLIGGAANTADGAIYAVPLIRDGAGHIVGFGGDATFYTEGAFNDGGLVYGPGGVLFASRWPVNQLGQTLPGSPVTNKIIDLAPFGVEGSHSAINFVPTGYPGAGRAKLNTWAGGQWLDAVFAPDGLGTYDLLSATDVPASRLPGGPEGWAYVPLDAPVFGATPTMILSEFSAGAVSVYDLDINGDPIVASRRLFMDGLFGAEGAFIDPVTGDFLFSTFGGGDRVVVVTGFGIPTPGAAGALALGGLLAARRRRR